MGNRVFLRQPVIQPQGEARSALWIYKQLGERLGLGDYFQYADEVDYLNQQLAPLGVTLRHPSRRAVIVDMPDGPAQPTEYLGHAQRQDRN